MRIPIRLYFDTIADADIIEFFEGFASSRTRNDLIKKLIRHHIELGDDDISQIILDRLIRIETRMTGLSQIYKQSNTVINEHEDIPPDFIDKIDLLKDTIRNIGASND